MNVVTFKDNNIVLSDNIDGCDIKTNNIFNDYWIQCGIDIDGSDNNDKSGYSVALKMVNFWLLEVLFKHGIKE